MNTKISNAAFAKMTRAQKRVQIARDVLAQIAAKRLVPKRGTYLHRHNKAGILSGATNAPKNAAKDLRDLLREAPKCDACALGSIFMCAVERADKLKLRDMQAFVNEPNRFREPLFVEREDTTAYLDKWFSQRQLDEIEDCFESPAWLNVSLGELDAADRLEKIMKNIIRNRGTFRRDEIE